MEQNFKNHSRLVPLYHFIIPFILLSLTIAAVHHLYLAVSGNGEWYHPALLLLAVFALWIIWWYVRAFPIRAQDRLIMLEEKLRHQQLTGKPLNPKLRPSQIIALRFAADAEFPDLAEKAAAEDLDSRSIKQSIQNWKADYYRV